MFNYLLKSLFNQAIFYLCLLLFGLDSRMTPVAFCSVGYITIIHLLFEVSGSLLVHSCRDTANSHLFDHRTFPFILTFTGRLLILLYLIVTTSSKNPVSFGVILIPTRRDSPGFAGRLS